MVEFTIPDGLPKQAVARLVALHQELMEGDITEKGYRKHREQILGQFGLGTSGSMSSNRSDVYAHSRRPSGFESILSYQMDSPQTWSPHWEHDQAGGGGASGGGGTGSGGAEFGAAGPSHTTEFGSEFGGVGTGHLGSELGELQAPLPPRGIPETANTDPLNVKVQLSTFDNLPSILRYRGRTNGDIVAFQCLDEKGKESTSITWGKLAAKAEKVAQMLRDQSGLFRGDRVVLMYATHEAVEFVVALMGCFLAGLVAVPVSVEHVSMFLVPVLKMARSRLVLTTEQLYKRLVKLPVLVQLASTIVFWKTSDWGSYKGAQLPPLQVPDLAYIEFLRSSSGDLRGVVMSHRTILHQMRCLTALTQSRQNNTRSNDRLLCSLDVRRSTGMILGVLLTVYTGNQVYFLSPRSMATPGLYAHVISKHRATILLSDYPALKGVIYNYQADPSATRNYVKRHDPSLAHVRSCIVDVPTIDAEFMTVLTDRWLKPLGHRDPRSAAAPTLTLTEHGGMVAATLDFLTPRVGSAEVVVSLEALGRNRIEFVEEDDLTSAMGSGSGSMLDRSSQGAAGAGAGGSSSLSGSLGGSGSGSLGGSGSGSSLSGFGSGVGGAVPPNGGMRVCSFGYPIPDATIAIVDPDTRILSGVDVVGEIWIDSPSLSGGFWDHAEDTGAAFHAKCYSADGELAPEFLRTGLLGFLKDGMVYVLGTRVDRLIQLRPEPKYFYSFQLLETLMRTVPDIYDGCIFQVPLKLSTADEAATLLNVVLLESPKAPAQPRHTNPLLEEMATQTIAVLRQNHGFKVYAVVICAPGSAPRTIRSGKPDIAKVAARRQFLQGTLAASHIKFDLEGSEIELARGDDVQGGIWGRSTSMVRMDQLEAAGSTEKQYSGVDMRSNILDDRMATSLDEFESLIALLQWRVRRQPDELAFLSVTSPNTAVSATSNTKETSWRQLGGRVTAVYHYITKHLHVNAGQVACLIYTQSEDFVHAVYACFLAGIVVIPVAPINIERVAEDITSLQKVIQQFKVGVLLGNSETHSMMEDKQIQQYLKARQIHIPKLHNTSKARNSDDLKSMLSIKAPPPSPTATAMVWLHFTSDHEYTASIYTTQQLLGMCKIQKETCQMTATKPIIGCVRSVSGLGFLYTCCLGVYMGNFTILISPVDYANNPAMYFVATSRYKVKDGYGTLQMLQHAVKQLQKPKGFDLSELNNLVVPLQGRADLEMVNQMRLTFAAVSLETVAINIAYGPVCNPMATTRSYMQVENIDLWLDPIALRQGLVSLVNPNNTPNALHLVDSGMVPINTQVAIVNPETLRLCRTGEIGEIWVVSEGNQIAQAVQGSAAGRLQQSITEEIVDGEPGIKYMRTGDLGFLHTVTKGPSLEMQVLFVTGSIRNTLDFNGLQHFADDLEASVVASNEAVVDCVVAMCGGILCCIVETSADVQHLSSLAAVITNELLVDHQLAPNVVSFLPKGGLPRSRLGEKQRKTLLKLYTGETKPSNSVPGKQFKTMMDFAVQPVDF